MWNKLIAYLIQAHNNPKHLYKLILSLNNDEYKNELWFF